MAVSLAVSPVVGVVPVRATVVRGARRGVEVLEQFLTRLPQHLTSRSPQHVHERLAPRVVVRRASFRPCSSCNGHSRRRKNAEEMTLGELVQERPRFS